jgi:hypothetical protein
MDSNTVQASVPASGTVAVAVAVAVGTFFTSGFRLQASLTDELILILSPKIDKPFHKCKSKLQHLKSHQKEFRVKIQNCSIFWMIFSFLLVH